MARAGVVLVDGDLVALIRRDRDGETYYLFPGGGVEDGESEEQAAVRESSEELGLEVRIVRLLAEVAYNGTSQRYFLASLVGGVFGSGDGEEMQGEHVSKGRYTPVWLPVVGLSLQAVHPNELAVLVERSVQEWPAQVLRFEDPGRLQRSA